MSGNALNAFAVGWARWRTDSQAWLSAARSVVVAVYPGSVGNSGACAELALTCILSEAAVSIGCFISDALFCHYQRADLLRLGVVACCVRSSRFGWLVYSGLERAILGLKCRYRRVNLQWFCVVGIIMINTVAMLLHSNC